METNTRVAVIILAALAFLAVLRMFFRGVVNTID